MSSFFQKSKKLARLKAARKQLPKAKRAFFVMLMMTVAMHFQAQLLEQNAGGNSAIRTQMANGY